MDYTFVITATAENALRVLQRMASLITRKRLRLQQIYVIEIGHEGSAHLTLAIRTDEPTMTKLMNQFGNMADILDVKIAHKTL